MIFPFPPVFTGLSWVSFICLFFIFQSLPVFTFSNHFCLLFLLPLPSLYSSILYPPYLFILYVNYCSILLFFFFFYPSFRLPYLSCHFPIFFHPLSTLFFLSSNTLLFVFTAFFYPFLYSSSPFLCLPYPSRHFPLFFQPLHTLLFVFTTFFYPSID